MKKATLLLAMYLITAVSFAQVRRNAPLPKTKQSIDSVAMADGKDTGNNKLNQKQLLKELNLTKEQAVKMKEIRQNNKTKKEAILNDDSLTEEQQQTKLKQLRKETTAATDAILNEEQKEKMKAIRKAMKEKKSTDKSPQQMNNEEMMAPANQ